MDEAVDRVSDVVLEPTRGPAFDVDRRSDVVL